MTVAYSLPGHTASGLPVGPGIVAVDPSVIPLGTHMSVPGYGPAIAADTGTAIRGAMLDLWFPTLAAGSGLGPPLGDDLVRLAATRETTRLALSGSPTSGAARSAFRPTDDSR